MVAHGIMANMMDSVQTLSMENYRLVHTLLSTNYCSLFCKRSFPSSYEKTHANAHTCTKTNTNILQSARSVAIQQEYVYVWGSLS